jgi:hypothetical protein
VFEIELGLVYQQGNHDQQGDNRQQESGYQQKA